MFEVPCERSSQHQALISSNSNNYNSNGNNSNNSGNNSNSKGNNSDSSNNESSKLTSKSQTSWSNNCCKIISVPKLKTKLLRAASSVASRYFSDTK